MVYGRFSLKREIEYPNNRHGYLWAYSRIARFEYMKAVLPALLLCILLGADDTSVFISPYVILIIPSLFLTYMSGFIVNAISDYEIDKTYGTYKEEIPKAVDKLGMRGIWIILMIHIVVPLCITLYVSLTLDKIELFILLCVGYFLGMGYSLKPFTFKTRGIWHVISLASCALLLPMLFIYLLFSSRIQFPDLVIIFGFTTLHYLLTLTNQAVDYFEDKKYDVHNPTVVWGLKRSLYWAMVFMVMGLVIMIIGLIFKAWALMETSFLFSEWAILLIPGMVILLVISYIIPFMGTRDLLRIAKMDMDDGEKAKRMKARIHYSMWHTSGIVGLTVIVSVMFASVQLWPV